jgi:hypothetical protein
VDSGGHRAGQASVRGKRPPAQYVASDRRPPAAPPLHGLQSECHFFAIAAYKLLEYRKWVPDFGLCSSVDFVEVDRFSEQDIRDLRNMLEHVIDYFTGGGNAQTRWFVQTPEYRADASAVAGTMIGGRLDWVAFGAAAERLLPRLLAEPILTRLNRPQP